MSSSSSFEEFSGSSKEESVGKTLGLTSTSLEASSVEVTSPLLNVMVAEGREHIRSSLRLSYGWVHYEVREKFFNFQSYTNMLNFANLLLFWKIMSG